MKEWVSYAIMASAAFGLSAIPLKFALGRVASAPSEITLLSSCFGAFLGAVIYFLFSGRTALSFSSFDAGTIILSSLSGITSVAGSLAVIKALSHPASSVSNVMSLVNTNVLFTMLFGIVIFRDMPEGIEAVKVITGALLIVAGAVLICR